MAGNIEPKELLFAPPSETDVSSQTGLRCWTYSEAGSDLSWHFPWFCGMECCGKWDEL